jgi:hypothetical protein
MDKTKLTRREASHFIAAAITAEKIDLRKKNRRDRRKGLKTPHPPGAPLYSHDEAL